LSNERCENYYDDLNDAPTATDDTSASEECPELVEVNSNEATSSSNNDDDNHQQYVTAIYVVVPILAVAVVVAALIVYRSRYIQVQQKSGVQEEGLDMRKSAATNPMSAEDTEELPF
jgi:hypothetical protein